MNRAMILINHNKHSQKKNPNNLRLVFPKNLFYKLKRK